MAFKETINRLSTKIEELEKRIEKLESFRRMRTPLGGSIPRMGSAPDINYEETFKKDQQRMFE